LQNQLLHSFKGHFACLCLAIVVQDQLQLEYIKKQLKLDKAFSLLFISACEDCKGLLNSQVLFYLIGIAKENLVAAKLFF
jgi:hypothetical protein